MSFNITIKLSGDKKVDPRALAQQIANILESFTGVRTMVRVQPVSGRPK